MNKLESLNYLLNIGLNVHSFTKVDNMPELVELANVHKNLSVRFDNADGTLQLPFIALYDGKWSIDDIVRIDEIMKTTNSYLIVTDGINHDSSMMYNIVITVDRQGKFSLDISNVKQPLRFMYSKPLTYVEGCLTEPIHWWTVLGNRIVDLRYIRNLAGYIYEKQIFDKYIELTTYNKNVGILNEDVVFWHLC